MALSCLESHPHKLEIYTLLLRHCDRTGYIRSHIGTVLCACAFIRAQRGQTDRQTDWGNLFDDQEENDNNNSGGGVERIFPV